MAFTMLPVAFRLPLKRQKALVLHFLQVMDLIWGMRSLLSQSSFVLEVWGWVIGWLLMPCMALVSRKLDGGS